MTVAANVGTTATGVGVAATTEGTVAGGGALGEEVAVVAHPTGSQRNAVITSIESPDGRLRPTTGLESELGTVLTGCMSPSLELGKMSLSAQIAVNVAKPLPRETASPRG